MKNNKISSHSEQKSKHSCKPRKVCVFLQHQASYKIPLNKRKGVKNKLFIDFKIVLKAGGVRNFFFGSAKYVNLLAIANSALFLTVDVTTQKKKDTRLFGPFKFNEHQKMSYTLVQCD